MDDIWSTTAEDNILFSKIGNTKRYSDEQVKNEKTVNLTEISMVQFQSNNNNYAVNSNFSNSNNKCIEGKEETTEIETSKKKSYGVEQPTTCNMVKANRYRKYAIAVSWLSILTTLAVCVIEFIVAWSENSTAAFGLAFSAVLDMVSSIVVLWRFYKAYDTFSAHRENMACGFLGSLFIISAITIGVKAVYNMYDGSEPDYSIDGLHKLLTTSIFSSLLCFLLMIVKIALSRKLSSRTLLTDAMNSLAAAVIAMSIVVTAEVNKKTQDLWFLDSAVGLVVSLFLLAYGGWLLKNHLPDLVKKR